MEKQMMTIKLGDTNYFKIIRGKRITRKQMHNNPGDIPVYSGHKEAGSIFGHISEEWLLQNEISIFKKNLVTINSNGNVGKVFLRNDPKYTLHDDVTGIEIVNSTINPQYLVFAVREAIVKAYFRYSAKLYIKRLIPLELKIPVKEDGTFDYDYQYKLAVKYERLQSLKKKVEDFSTIVVNSFITIDYELKNHVLIELGDNNFFKFSKGKRVRKKDIHLNPGKIPVISSSCEDDGYLGFISEIWLKKNDNPIFYGQHITINMDGSVGEVFLRTEEKYALNDVVVAVDIIDKKLNPIYVVYAIKEAIAKASYKYSAKLYLKRLSGLKIRIPINEKQEFDWLQQEQIANKYEKIEELKKTVKKFSQELEEKFIVSS